MKMKEFGPPGGGRVPGAPLRSATDISSHFSHHEFQWKTVSEVSGPQLKAAICLYGSHSNLFARFSHLHCGLSPP